MKKSRIDEMIEILEDLRDEVAVEQEKKEDEELPKDVSERTDAAIDEFKEVVHKAAIDIENASKKIGACSKGYVHDTSVERVIDACTVPAKRIEDLVMAELIANLTLARLLTIFD